jgi:hypothetical protein
LLEKKKKKKNMKKKQDKKPSYLFLLARCQPLLIPLRSIR